MRDAQITLPWADGDYTFRLGWGELELLQEACNAGPYVILNRLMSEQWFMGDIAHTIRLGLIGGGMKPADALKKVRDYVQNRPPAENVPYAQGILSAGLAGAPEEGEVGESEAASQEPSLTTFLTES
ncbi:gene transfer agent family protein [Neorhizobium alkalisoli]|uniref:Tail tube GTA-gp10-like protein n=1 Tax=Neorhizobium alkalisoli TaxID=528178 RepID=A0A561QS99_9HYPH|nr:gene transfer agent family protein [Neorhizobium alkalisoli]TWF53265.1 tail tube GTA-gp10-like protein [Neorhizobium alkalisoli]